MKYLGRKSVSSVMCIILRILWIGLLTALIAGVIIYGATLIFPSLTENIPEECALEFQLELKNSLTGKELEEWHMFTEQSPFIRALVIPYFVAVTVLLLNIVSKTRQIFVHFTNDVIFDKGNTEILRKISKFNLAYAILTINVTLLLISIVLFVFCHVFERGSNLQEDLDLTI